MQTSDLSLRIGFFTDSYLPQINGVAFSVQALAGYLFSKGHVVHIVAPRFRGWQDADRYVHRVASSRLMNNPPIDLAWPITPASWRTLDQLNLDLIHMHTPLTIGWAAHLIARQQNIPLIYTYHTAVSEYTHYVKGLSHAPGFTRLAGWFSGYTANWSDTIIIPSTKFDPLLRRQGVKRPIQVIPNGIDLDMFYQKPSNPCYRQELNLEEEDPLLLVVSRLAPEKRIDFIIEAFGVILSEFPQARLVIAGDGSERANLERQAATTTYRARITFLGMVERSRLPELLHSADLFLSASTTEVHPLSVIEAIASGLPVIAVRDEALNGLVEEGVNGHLTVRDVPQFSAAVVRVLSSKQLKDNYRMASRKISERYSIKSTAEALLRLYYQALEAKAAEKFSNGRAPVL